MEFAEKLVCILLSFGILLNAIAVRRYVGAWSAPAAMYCLFWFGYTFIPLAVLPTVPANPLAILFILLSGLAFSVGVFTRRWYVAWRVNALNEGQAGQIYDTPFLASAFYASAIIGIGCILVDMVLQGVSLSDLSNNLLGSAGAYIERRYSGDLVANLFGQAGNVLSYLAASLGGLISAGKRKLMSRVTVTAAAMIPSLVVMLAQGAKGMLFLSIAMFVAGTIVRRVHSGDRKIFNRKIAVQSLGYFAILIPIVTISFISRGLQEERLDTLFRPLLRYYASYTSGHLYAFSDWFTSYTGGLSRQFYALEHQSYGFYTVMSIFQMFGDNRYVPPGVYAEYFQYSDFLQSNIFTYFRGLITDFGLFGSLALIAVASALVHDFYYRLVSNRRSYFAASFYIFLIGYFYTSFIISLLIWDTPYLVLAATWVVLIINSMRFQPQSSRVASASWYSGRAGESGARGGL